MKWIYLNDADIQIILNYQIKIHKNGDNIWIEVNQMRIYSNDAIWIITINQIKIYRIQLNWNFNELIRSESTEMTPVSKLFQLIQLKSTGMATIF